MEILDLCLNVELNLIKHDFKPGHFVNHIAWERAACQIELEELTKTRKVERQQANNSAAKDKLQGKKFKMKR